MRVSPSERVSVRPRTVRHDLEWLRAVISWARKWRDTNGRQLLETNPTELFDLPEDTTPRRPIATHDRFLLVRAAAEHVVVQTRRPGWRRSMASYLPELLDLANETGRRIGAIRQLRVRDLCLEASKAYPHGSILWPASTDKIGKEWLVPVTKTACAAIKHMLKNRPNADPDDYLFPSPSDPAVPVSRELVNEWLREAERLAEVEKQDGTLWHAYRRKWASERKDGSLADVAFGGGWSDTRTLLRIYQQVDAATLYEVVSTPKRLREAK